MAFNSAAPVQFESVSATTSTPDVSLGTKVNVNGNDYVYVYNGAASDINQYEGCIISFLSGYTVTVSSVSGRDLAFGVARNATIAAGKYGWVMTRGFTNVKNGRVNSALVSSPVSIYITDDGAFNWSENAANTAASHAQYIVGKAIGSGVSGGTGTSYFAAYVKCIG